MLEFRKKNTFYLDFIRGYWPLNKLLLKVSEALEQSCNFPYKESYVERDLPPAAGHLKIVWPQKNFGRWAFILKEISLTTGRKTF